jgi:hypothetical protein
MVDIIFLKLTGGGVVSMYDRSSLTPKMVKQRKSGDSMQNMRATTQ